MLILALLLLNLTSAQAATVAEHQSCADATRPINEKMNEIFKMDGFHFTMNRIQRGFKPHRINDQALPTFWVVLDGKVYVHNLVSVPTSNGGEPDVYQNYRFSFDVPGKGLYCVSYSYRLGNDLVREAVKGACNPARKPMRDQQYLGQLELKELRVSDKAGAAYMLQDLIEDNIRETARYGEQLAEWLQEEQQKKDGNPLGYQERLTEIMNTLHKFDWSACEAVARDAEDHSVRKGLDMLAKTYLKGALVLKLSDAPIPKECL